jgi:hypothetical protein
MKSVKTKNEKYHLDLHILPPQTLAPRPSLTECEHQNAKHYAIEEHEERLTVGDKKICVKIEFRICALNRKC